MACFGGVIKICTDTGGNLIATNNTTSNNTQNNTNQTNNIPTSGSVIVDLNALNATPIQTVNQTNETISSSQTNGVETTAVSNNGVIVNINNTSVEGVPPRHHNAKRHINIGQFVRHQLVDLGAIRNSQNPIEFALNKINNDKAFIENFVNALKNVLNIHIYENVDKTQNLYQYSLDANGKNTHIHEWLEVNNNQVKFALDVNTPKVNIHKWIYIDKNTDQINYVLNLSGKNVQVNETFNGTPAKYTYSLNIQHPNQNTA